jgi:hypothetical protein
LLEEGGVAGESQVLGRHRSAATSGAAARAALFDAWDWKNDDQRDISRDLPIAPSLNGLEISPLFSVTFSDSVKKK